jgi:pimeloyl-ACP methyl ester carboxylesterase
MTHILIPGAGGDAFYWHRVVPLLPGAIAIDLPAGQDGAGLAEYADVIAGAIEGRDGVVLVAQSMGAYSAPIAAVRGGVSRIVLVAPMIPAPGESAGEFWAASGQLEAMRALAVAEGRDPDAPFDLDTMFFHDVAPDVVERLLAQGDTRDEVKSFEDPWPLGAWPDVPTTVVAGARDRLFPLEFMRGLARSRLGLDDVTVVDSGHLPALSRPEELARAILAA